MQKSSLALSLGLTLTIVGMQANLLLASDWEEDPAGPGQHHRADQMPPVAPPRFSAPSTNVRLTTQPGSPPLLQGGVGKIRTLEAPAPATVSAMQAAAEQRNQQLARIDAGTEAFMAGATLNSRVPPAVFKAWIDRTHPQFQLSADKNLAQRLLNVKGQWDDSTKPMNSLGIRHTTIKEKDLRTIPLDGVRVIVINCAGYIPRDALQRLRDFVGRGGYLITTDWALENTTQKAFPGYIAWSGEKTANTVTDAYVLDPDPVLFNGVPVRRATWKLDRGSQAIRIVNPGKVKVLVRSSRMAATDVNLLAYPDKSYAGALAVVFQFGRGKVLHVISHYDNNADSFRANTLPDPVPEIGISLRQALITNFIIEALENSGEPRLQPLQ